MDSSIFHSLQHRTKVLSSLRELKREDVKEIKFLMKGLNIGAGTLEEIETAMDLFEVLENLG